jgi:hypothetical protein
MILFKRVKIRSYEVGLYFRDGEFKRLLSARRYWLFDPLWKVQVDVVSQRAPWLVHEKLDVIVKSGALAARAVVVDLKDYEPGRFLVFATKRGIVVANAPQSNIVSAAEHTMALLLAQARNVPQADAAQSLRHQKTE